MKRTVLALSLLWVLAGTAPASAAFLGENPHLGESFPNTGIGPAAGDVSRELPPGSGGARLERPAECFVAPAAAEGELSPEYLEMKGQRGIPDDIMNMGRKEDLAQIDQIAKDIGGLTKAQRELLHRAISKQEYTLEEIKDIAKDIKDLHPNK